jgi:hypothetical protein
MDPNAAAKLIAEDTLSSRSIAYDETERVAEFRQLSPKFNTSNGFGSASQRKEYDMEADDLNGTGTGERLQYQESMTPPHHINGIKRSSNEYSNARRRSSYSQQNNDSPGAKQRRLIWWRAAATNVVYILAWYAYVSRGSVQIRADLLTKSKCHQVHILDADISL